MNSLQDITVVAEGSLLTGGTPAIRALLAELQDHLNKLHETDESTVIDVMALLSQLERERLRQLLGQGELSATLQAFGPSLIQETRIPGIWHIEHRNAEDQPIAELLMVTRCPDILMTPQESLSESHALLAALIDGKEGL